MVVLVTSYLLLPSILQLKKIPLPLLDFISVNTHICVQRRIYTYLLILKGNDSNKKTYLYCTEGMITVRMPTFNIKHGMITEIIPTFNIKMEWQQ